MTAWTPCPDHCRARFSSDDLQRHWAQLHVGDALPWPDEPALLEGWRLYHQGDFQAAAELGLSLGTVGLALANKAACIHATYVEARDPVRFERLQEVAERARRHLVAVPGDATNWYWQGYALGRYSQGISVAKALARGLGRQVRQALESALRLAPRHVDAHLALARFHAETIDQVGELIGGMVHGARKDQGLALYDAALSLAPDSVIVQNEVAEGLWMLEGESAQARAARLLEQALRHEPLDAMEKLYLRSVQATTP
jgi:tetratricopeptide (TPR) repeat protein